MAHRVLVVDDEVPLGEYLADALHGRIRGRGRRNGRRGITAARARRPDVILLDLGLPGGLSGDQAMLELLHFAPVIIITGRDNEDLVPASDRRWRVRIRTQAVRAERAPRDGQGRCEWMT